MNFVTIKAQNTMEALYDAVLNADYINYIVPSMAGQAGRSIIKMALIAGESNGGAGCAAMDDLTALKSRLPNLRQVSVYSTGQGLPVGPALVNWERIMRIFNEESHVKLHFVDGDELIIEQMPL